MIFLNIKKIKNTLLQTFFVSCCNHVVAAADFFVRVSLCASSWQMYYCALMGLSTLADICGQIFVIVVMSQLYRMYS